MHRRADSPSLMEDAVGFLLTDIGPPFEDAIFRQHLIDDRGYRRDTMPLWGIIDTTTSRKGNGLKFRVIKLLNDGKWCVHVS